MTENAGEANTAAYGPLAPGPLGLAAGYTAVALAPLAAAWVVAPQGLDALTELGTGLALAGYAMMLAQFAITGRFRNVSGRVGIDVVMRLHKLMARVATVFVLVHPFFYGAERLVTDPGAYVASLARTVTAAPFFTGVLAWLLLVVLMVMAVHRARLPLTYEAWRASHGIGALVIAAAGLDHAFTVGQLSPSQPAATLWWILFGVAVATLAHVYLLRPLLLMRNPFRVSEVRQLGPGRWLLALKLERGRFDYRAGQFAWLKVAPHPFGLNENPFSIVSAPGMDSGSGEAGWIEFLIREAGDFTRTVGTIPVGARAWLDGPHGAFTLAPGPAQETVVMVAGGVGLAPILSLLREAAAQADPRPFHLIYGNRIAAQVVMRDEIEALRKHLNLTVDYVVAEPGPGWDGAVGQLDAATLDTLFGTAPELHRARAWLCGPPAMVTAATNALTGLGIAPERISSERFDYD